MGMENKFMKLEANQQQILQRLSYLEKLLIPHHWHSQFLSPQSYHMPSYSPVQSHHQLQSYFQLQLATAVENQQPLQSLSHQQQPRSSSQVEMPGQNSSVDVGLLPLGHINMTNSLPSSSIKKDSLATIEDVLDKYPNLRGESKAGTLACKIAKEAIFGTDVLKQCTPNGTRELPALPFTELFELKKAMFMQFPQYWRCPVEFEPVWKKCVDAVQQACKRLRLENKN